MDRSPNKARVIKSRRLRRKRHVAGMEEGSSAFRRISTDKPTGKIHLGRLRHRWEDNIRMNFKEIDINMRNWVDLVQNRNFGESL